VCTLNILNPLKFTVISHLTKSRHHIHIDHFALTETWITSSSSNTELLNATPPGFYSYQLPSPYPSHKISSVGTAFLIYEPASLLSAPTQTFKSFEMSAITLKLFSSNQTIFNVDRPPQATTKNRKPVPFSDILTDLDTFLSLAATTPHESLVTGDFNLHLVGHTNYQSLQFLSALNSTIISLNFYLFPLIRKIIYVYCHHC